MKCPACDTTLASWNRLGYCLKHRSKSPKRLEQARTRYTLSKTKASPIWKTFSCEFLGCSEKLRFSSRSKLDKILCSRHSHRKIHLFKEFGLTLEDYDQLLTVQGGVCFICENPPKNKALSVDHEHVKGFKKLPPEEKRKYIRGLLCYQCNRMHMARGMNVKKTMRILTYLNRYKLQQIFNKPSLNND